jgi:serine protease Do
VIGIKTAIYSPSGGSVGIGFAVPSNIAKHVAVQLKEHGHVTWGWLGIATQSVTPAIARSFGLDADHPSGALVALVTAGSPAARAGIKQGDVITTAAGHEIKSVHDLPRLVAAIPIGAKLPLTIVRDGKQRTVEAAIGEMPQNVASAEREPAEPGSGKAANALGMELLLLDPQLRKELKIPKDLNGVVVGQVTSGSPAGEPGIQPGDVIVSVDQRPVTTPEGAAAQLKQAAVQGNVLLLLNRHRMSQFVGLSVENNGTAGSSR